MLLLVGCGETAGSAPDPEPDSAVRQRAFTPRRAPTVASPSPTPDPTPTAAATPARQAIPTATVVPGATGHNQAPFVQVGTGENHACAVRSDGTAECWGGNDQGQLDLPRGVTFRRIASGWRFSCGITNAGTLACWGRNNHQQATPPKGQFSAVTAGWDHACAIGRDGATCWGREVDDRTAVPPGVAFTAIGAGAEHSCGLTADGDLACWGKNDNGRAESRPGPFRALAVGVAHTCVVRSDGTALCQGQVESGQPDPPATRFDSMSAGDQRTCGTLPTGQVECWDAGPADAPLATFGPPGAYTAVSVGWDDACGINEAGQIACWSSDPDPLPEPYNRLLVVNAFPDIELAQPVDLIPWPSGGLAVADKTGSIEVLSSEFGSRPVLDLTDVVFSSPYEAGLLSLAIDPDFEQSPYLYVYYSRLIRDDTVSRGDDDPDFARLSRFPIVDGIAVREQELIILDIPRTTLTSTHWGGAIRFGPDGMLYLGIGDSACLDECSLRLDSWHGKIIRIDVRGATADRPYRIPADNPQWDAPNARPEIWAYGLRNPWRMAFDSQNGRLWVGDVGHASQEEVSLVTRGSNLGWPHFEGFGCDRSGGNDEIDPRLVSAYLCQYQSNLTMPVAAYGKSDGCAVVGGPVYRGDSIPSLNGVYLFGDYCLGRVWAFDGDAEPGWQLIEIADLDRPLSSFGIDADGEVVMLTFGGPLVRLVQTQLGYAESVTRKARVRSRGAPLDPTTFESLEDRGD